MRRFDLTGKVAVVTGGNGGIGMARGLAECGGAVVVAGCDAAKSEAAFTERAGLGGAAAVASAVLTNVTHQGQCRAMVAEG
jgi:2-deoxy-D-gluconate 3-dehydrogenase